MSAALLKNLATMPKPWLQSIARTGGRLGKVALNVHLNRLAADHGGDEYAAMAVDAETMDAVGDGNADLSDADIDDAIANMSTEQLSWLMTTCRASIQSAVDGLESELSDDQADDLKATMAGLDDTQTRVFTAANDGHPYIPIAANAAAIDRGILFGDGDDDQDQDQEGDQ